MQSLLQSQKVNTGSVVHNRREDTDDRSMYPSIYLSRFFGRPNQRQNNCSWGAAVQAIADRGTKTAWGRTGGKGKNKKDEKGAGEAKKRTLCIPFEYLCNACLFFSVTFRVQNQHEKWTQNPTPRPPGRTSGAFLRPPGGRPGSFSDAIHHE